MNRYRAALIIVLSLGCSDISSVKTGDLQIAPEEIVFRELDPGSRVGTSLVEVRNVGDARIGISGMRVEERDERLELSIIDSEDHQGERFLAPGDVEFIDLEWRALDAQADEGRFIVTLADGSEVAVPVRTPDIDPRIRVESEPMGVPTEEGLTVSFLDAAPSEFQAAIITVSSQSIAALDLSTLCLLTPEGDCIDDNRDGGFMICNGRPLEPSGCMPLSPPDSALGFEDEFTFTAFYQPGINDVDRISRQVLVESNARVPTFFISFVGEPCIRMTPSDTCGLCGDGEVNGREECDDGNVNNADECTNTCTLPICGDGVLQGDEECDDGNTNENDPCTNSCTNAVCGDGVVFEGLEACDDGNDDNTDACTDQCQSTGCGDGIVQAGEACDDGNQDDNDGCSNDCVATSCGDMVLQGNETCDDGNQITESCPYGESSCQVCDARCNLVDGATSFCGDTRLDSGSGEQCDDGNALTEPCAYGEMNCTVCDANCQSVAGNTSFCGDGVVDRQNGETCEPNNGSTCDFASGLVFYENSNQVPAQTEDRIYIIDVDGMDETTKADILSQAHLLNFDASFNLNAVTEIEAARQNGNEISSRQYLLLAVLSSDFYDAGGNSPFQHSFQLNNQTSAGNTNYHGIPYDAHWSSPARNVAVTFENIDMFTDGFYSSATITTWIDGGNRIVASNAMGTDDLNLVYNYTLNTVCGAPGGASQCIAAGEEGACTFADATPTDPCETENPPAECDQDPGFGLYVLNPIVTHQCTFLGTPIVNLALSQLDFVEEGNTLRVRVPRNQSQPSFPQNGLTQTPIPQDGTFNATATISGGCQENFRLSGTFTDRSRSEWRGELELCFIETDMVSCSLTTECGPGSCFNYPVSGQRVHTP